jgi:sulfur transfer protein SufE
VESEFFTVLQIHSPLFTLQNSGEQLNAVEEGERKREEQATLCDDDVWLAVEMAEGSGEGAALHCSST